MHTTIITPSTTRKASRLARFLLVSFVLLAACQPARNLPATATPVAAVEQVQTAAPTTLPAPTRTASAIAGAVAGATAPATAIPPQPEAPSPEPSATQPAQETREQIGEIPSADGPKPLYFPAPGDPLETWESLAGTLSIQDIQWVQYTGKVESSLLGNTTDITFQYPSGWTIGSRDTTRHISALNSSGTSGQADGEFLKLEILYNAARPTVSSEQPGDFQAHPVEIAGSPGLLIDYAQDPGRLQVLSVIFKHNDAWYIAAVYINLPQSDPIRVDRHRAMLFSMFQSIRIGP